MFGLDPSNLGTFDVVYSWGVLHHTGAMYKAIAKASAVVSPQGILALGLYGTNWDSSPFVPSFLRVLAFWAPAITSSCFRNVWNNWLPKSRRGWRL